MAIFDDFLQHSGLGARLDEHRRFLEQQQAQTGLGAIPATLKQGAGNIGLMVEGLGNLGKLASGGVMGGIGQVAPGLSSLTDAAYNEYMRQGGGTQPVADDPGYTLAAMMAAHEAAAGENKYVTGIIDAATDPTNLIPTAPAERLVANAAKRASARLTAGAALSPEFAEAGVRDAANVLADKELASTLTSDFEEKVARSALKFVGSEDRTVAAFGRAAKRNEKAAARQSVLDEQEAARRALLDEQANNINDAQANIAAYLTKRQESPKGELITELGGQLPGVRDKTQAAYDARETARVIFRESKKSQDEFVRAAVKNGHGESGARAWWVELMEEDGGVAGLDFPAPGENFRSFTGDYDQSYYRLRAAEDKLYSRIRRAMDTPEVADLAPSAYDDALKGDPELQQILRLSGSNNSADKAAWQKIVAESDSLELGRVNGRNNAFMDTHAINAGPNEPMGVDDFERGLNFLPRNAAPILDAENVPLQSSIGELVPGLADATSPVTPRARSSPFTYDEKGVPVLPDNPLVAAAQAAPADSPQAIKASVKMLQEAQALADRTSVYLNEAQQELANAGGATTEATGRTWDLIRHAFLAAKESQTEAFKRERGGVVKMVSSLPSMWAGVTTQTVRNLLQDEAFVRLMLSHNKIGQANYNNARAVIIRRLEMGEKNEARLLGNVSDAGVANGWEELAGATVDPKLNKEFWRRMGGSAWELEADNAAQLNALEQLAVNTALGVANPTRAVTNLALMPLGLLSEGRQKMFQIINNVTHTAARGEAFKSAYLPYINNSAEVLLRKAEEEGLNTAALRGRSFIEYNGKQLTTEGMFNPEEVTRVLGARYGDEWRRMVAQAKDAGFAESSRVFGNFADKGPVEKRIAGFLPFMSWAWRAYPRVAEMVFSHPAVAAGLYQYYRLTTQEARNNDRKSYQYGTIGINNETPLVGLVASLFTPEQEAEIRVNPLSFFSPIGGEQVAMLAGADKEGRGNDENVYQQLSDIAGITGASFNPLIQAGAYTLGWDYKTPGALSRYSPVDMAMDNLGGGQLGILNVPTTQAPMRAARDLVRETFGRGGAPDNFDPIEKKAYELVFERTGKPASDKSNNQLAAQIRNHTGIYLEAEKAIDIGGARRALFNANSPISAQTNTETGEAIRKARAALPFTNQDVIAAQRSGAPTLARLLQDAIDEHKANNPAAAAQDRPAYFKQR